MCTDQYLSLEERDLLLIVIGFDLAFSYYEYSYFGVFIDFM